MFGGLLSPRQCFELVKPGAKNLSKLSAATAIQSQLGREPSQALGPGPLDIDSLDASLSDDRHAPPLVGLQFSMVTNVAESFAASLSRSAFARRVEVLVDSQHYCDASFAQAINRLLSGKSDSSSGEGCNTLEAASQRLLDEDQETEAAAAGKPKAESGMLAGAASADKKLLRTAERYRLWCRCVGAKCQRTLWKILRQYDGESAAGASSDAALDLSAVRLGRAGAVPLLLALRDCPCERLRRLVLAGCSLDDDGVTALLHLAESCFPGLIHLDLTDNEQIQFKGGVAVQRFAARRMQRDGELWIGLDGTSVRPSTRRSIEKLCCRQTNK
jgi:hypothetical protein